MTDPPPARYLEGREIRIRYHRTGGGPGVPALVLLHGFTDSGACFAPFADALGDAFDIVMPDARGHGGSSLPEGDFSHSGLVADAATVLRELTGPAVVVGHSMGASTAALLAATHPELVRAVVLEDAPWGERDDHDDATADFERWVVELQRLDAAGRLARAQVDHPRWSVQECERWAAAKAEMHPDLFDRRFEWLARPWAEFAAQIQAPTLVLTGDAQAGAIMSAAVAERAVALIPQAAHTHIPDAGHSIRRDQPEAYLAALRAFISAADGPRPFI